MTPDEIVAEYAHLFRFPYLLTIENRADWRELESLKDSLWYINGYYDALGHDRHGVTYRLVDKDTSAASEVERRQEANESYDFWHER